MKVAWLHDQGNADGTKGGAELTMDEFRAAAPDGVEFTDLDKAEVVVVGNCVTLDLCPWRLAEKRVIRYHHDLARHEPADVREWMNAHAEHVFTSPLHRDRYGIDGALIPPAIDLDRYKPTRQTRRNTERGGACTIASWQNPGKGGSTLWEWCQNNDADLHCYGPGPFVPTGPGIRLHDTLEPAQVAQTLHEYETFVFLPTAPEPFGRCVVEAWAAGLDLVVNSLVGARYWIEEKPEALRTASADFWGLVYGG